MLNRPTFGGHIIQTSHRLYNMYPALELEAVFEGSCLVEYEVVRSAVRVFERV